MDQKICHLQKVHFARKYSDHTILVLVWKSAHLPSPVLPDPKEFGWRWNSSEKSYESIMTKNFPALESVIELCICKCKTGYTSLRFMF